MQSADVSLSEDLLLLAADAPRRRLRLALRAAGHAEVRRTSLRRATNALTARGLVTRSGWRRHRPTRQAGVAARRAPVSRALWKPREASDRDRELVALLLLAGALAGRERMHARSLLARIDPKDAPPAIAWLLDRYRVQTTAELADRLLRDTRPRQRFEDGAFNPGETSGIWS